MTIVLVLYSVYRLEKSWYSLLYGVRYMGLNRCQKVVRTVLVLRDAASPFWPLIVPRLCPNHVRILEIGEMY